MSNAENTPMRVVLNRVPPRGSSADDARAVLKDAGATALKSQFGSRVGFSRSFGMGKTVFDLSAQQSAIAEVEAFRTELTALLRKLQKAA